MLINFSWLFQANLTVAGSGPFNRLQLRLDVKREYTCQNILTDTKGFRLFVHGQQMRPILPYHSVLLEPGKKTQVTFNNSLQNGKDSHVCCRCQSSKLWQTNGALRTCPKPIVVEANTSICSRISLTLKATVSYNALQSECTEDVTVFFCTTAGTLPK